MSRSSFFTCTTSNSVVLFEKAVRTSVFAAKSSLMYNATPPWLLSTLSALNRVKFWILISASRMASLRLVEMSKKRNNNLVESDDDSNAEDEDWEEEDDNYVPSPKKTKLSQNSTVEVEAEGNKGGHCGNLERVVIKNFMCLNHLDFPFGSRINFIQGRNGSGKSAVLSAVIVGLGGASRTTNRGSSLKALIKNGKQTATIEIALSNTGFGAYKPDVYGEAVIVERKIHSNGGGSYKIKSKNGKAISSKKEDLQAILQHFNLQVDNPITILNQDMARSFLNSNDPSTIFKFFMKATRFQLMETEYEIFSNHIQQSEEKLRSRKEDLPTLKKELDKWIAKRDYLCNLESSKNKVQYYRKELAWAKVKEEEEKVKDFQKQLERIEGDLAEISSMAAEGEIGFTREEKKGGEMQKEVNDRMGVFMKMHNDLEVKNANLRELAKEKHTLQCKKRSAEKEVRKFSEDAEGMREAMHKNQDLTKSTWAAKEAKRKEQKGKMQEEATKLEQEKGTVIHHLESLKYTRDKHKQDLQQQNFEEKALKRKLYVTEQELQSLKRDKNDSFTVFGQWVPPLNKEIEKLYRNRHFSAKPVGPLGAYIKLRDQKWAHVAELIIGRIMTAYCVNSANDAKVLKEVIRRKIPDTFSMPQVIVTHFRDHVHNVQTHEVRSDRYPSLWSILEISETVVANTLIDSLQVESILLIPTSQEAGALLMHERNVPRNCIRAYTLNGDTYYPDPNFKIYSGHGQGRAKYLQVSVEEKVSDLESDLQSSQEELNKMNFEIRNIQNEIRITENEMGSYAKKEHLLKDKITKIYGMISNIEAQEEPMPPDVNQLEEDLKEMEANKRIAEEKLESFNENVAELDSSEKEKKKEIEKAKRDLNTYKLDIAQLKQSLEEWNSRFEKHKKSLNSHQERKRQYLAKKEELEAQHKELVESLMSKTSHTEEEFGARTTSRRKVLDIQRDYRALAQHLEQQMAKCGDPCEVNRRCKEEEARYTDLCQKIEQESDLVKRLREGWDKRRAHYHKLRRNIAVVMKYHFRIHMSDRKLNGKIRVDFEEKKLIIEASKTFGEGSQSQKQKQALTMMSGGEKSFITVCFLLALWDSIDSPLRMLDEFDVFMDNVSRTQSLELLVGAAKMRPTCQFFFMTPQDLSLPCSDIVKIHRMPNPERNEDNFE